MGSIRKRLRPFLPTLLPIIVFACWALQHAHQALQESRTAGNVATVKVSRREAAVRTPSFPNLLPQRVCHPTVEKPFVFFHQRKTGGSSLRNQIWDSCPYFNWTCQVPCISYGCDAVVRRSWEYEVLAGHFTWSYVFSEEPLWQHEDQISCLTVFREPFERVRSCYYFSALETMKWSEMTTEQMSEALLTTSMGRLCLNEPIRIFSGITDNQLIADLHHHKVLSEEAVQLTIDNMSKCVVLMMDDFHKPATTAILSHWFPWLEYTKTKVNVNRAKPHYEPPLSPEVNASLARILAPEIAIYKAAQEQYQRQLNYITTWPRVTSCQYKGPWFDQAGQPLGRK